MEVGPGTRIGPYVIVSALGSGAQWFSWVGLDDVVAAYLAALDDDRYRGPINLVGPETVRQAAFARAVGEVLHRPSFFPAPAFGVKLVLGELAE